MVAEQLCVCVCDDQATYCVLNPIDRSVSSYTWHASSAYKLHGDDCFSQVGLWIATPPFSSIQRKSLDSAALTDINLTRSLSDWTRSAGSALADGQHTVRHTRLASHFVVVIHQLPPTVTLSAETAGRRRVSLVKTPTVFAQCSRPVASYNYTHRIILPCDLGLFRISSVWLLDIVGAVLFARLSVLLPGLPQALLASCQ